MIALGPMGWVGTVGTLVSVLIACLVLSLRLKQERRTQRVLTRYCRGVRVTEDELRLVNAERIARGRSPWRRYML